MSKKVESIMKMPENVKLVSTVEDYDLDDDYVTEDFTAVVGATAVNWIAAAGTVAGYALIPDTSELIAIPFVLTMIVGMVGLVTGFFVWLEKVPYTIIGEMNSRVGLGDSNILGAGAKISFWSRSSGAAVAHFFLPLRIFKKVKLYESITYFPLRDQYIKESHYLTFSKFRIVKETFDGHRAVFNKAIDSF